MENQESSKWKKFRRRKVKTLLSPLVYYYSDWVPEIVGFKLDKHAHFIENGWQQHFFLEENFEEINEFLFSEFVKDNLLIHKKFEESKEIAKDLLAFCEKYFVEDKLKERTNKELILLFEIFLKYHSKFGAFSIPYFLFLSERIKKELVKKEYSEDTILLLSTPTDQSYSNLFQIKLLEFVYKIIEEKIDCSSFKRFMEELRKVPDLLFELEVLVERFFWIPFEYKGPDVYDFEKIFELVRNAFDSVENLEKKLEEIKNREGILKEQQRNLINGLKIEEDKIFFEALQKGILFQDLRKEFAAQHHFRLQKLFKEFARRTNLDYNDFYYLLFEEIEQLLMIGGNVEKRKEKALAIVSPLSTPKISILQEDGVDDFLRKENLLERKSENQQEIIHGEVVYPGYVKGFARVVFFTQDFSGFKEKEILITPMTTPDFVPLMEKAAAIVTDEGGVTCHAAIVAREMKIPCIVGTGNATSAIKTGDFIEVNAESGDVRKISK